MIFTDYQMLETTVFTVNTRFSLVSLSMGLTQCKLYRFISQ